MGFSYPLTNKTSMVEILVGVNNATNGRFGVGLIVAIFLITYLALLRFENKERFASSIFMTFLASMFFYAMGLVSSSVVMWTIVLTVGIMIAIWVKSDG